MTRLLSAALCIGVAVVSVGCGDNGGQHTQAPAVSAEQLTIEQKFILGTTGEIKPLTDASVKRAAELLERSAKEYGIPKDKAADMAYRASEVLKSEKVSTSGLEVLEGIALAYVPDSGVDFAQMAAMYVTLRKEGMPHAEAMMGMKGLISKVTEMGQQKPKK